MDGAEEPVLKVLIVVNRVAGKSDGAGVSL